MRKVLVLLVCASVLVTACSSDGQDGAPTTSAAEASTSAPAASTTSSVPIDGTVTCPQGCTPPTDIGPAGDRTLPLEVATDGLGIDLEPYYGRGAALVDLDGDGWDDLFLSDTDARLRGDDFGVSRAYRNVEGRFEPWDLGFAVDDLYQNGGAIFGDYTNDGAPDALLLNGNNTGASTLALYENRLAEEGRFVRADDAGVTDAEDYWWGATWLDIDGDERLDLVVTGLELLLYRNLGDGTFEEVAADRGVGLAGNLHNPIALDIEGDGDEDLFVPALTGSHLFENDGTGQFRDVTTEALGEDFSGPASWGWIADVADVDQDGDDDVWLGRWYYRTKLLENQGDGTFDLHDADVGIDARVMAEDPAAIGGPDPYAGLLDEGDDGRENTMGLLVADLDVDGYPDALLGPGSPTSANPTIVYCGVPAESGGGFERCSEPVRTATGLTRGHGATAGDVDHDGDLDLIVGPGGFPPFDAATDQDTRERPLVMVGTTGGAGTARIRLAPSVDGRPVESSRIEVRDGERRTYATIRSSHGFENQTPPELVAPVSGSAEVVVTWPDGRRSTAQVAPGGAITVVRP